MTEVERAAAVLAESARAGRPIVAFTGAGISQESGVPTFRGAAGLWTEHQPARVASREGFVADPAYVWRFHEELRRVCREAAPNPAHIALAWIETALADSVPTPVITQNIDGLHQEGGSRDVIELHGNAQRVRCTRCAYTSDDLPTAFEELPPLCACGALLRPDVVWLGEELPREAMRRAQQWAEQGGVMLIVGTSATVQPAATLPMLALQHGAALVEINPEATPISALAQVSLRGRAGRLLPELAEALATALDT